MAAARVLVVIEDWSRLTQKAIHFALRLSGDVIAVHLSALAGPDGDDQETALRERWAKLVQQPAEQAGLPSPRLLCLRADYRNMHQPLVRLLHKMEQSEPDRAVAVLIPELVKHRWWQFALHTQRARRLRAHLLGLHSARVVVINVPWQLGSADDGGDRGAAPLRRAAGR